MGLRDYPPRRNEQKDLADCCGYRFPLEIVKAMARPLQGTLVTYIPSRRAEVAGESIVNCVPNSDLLEMERSPVSRSVGYRCRR